MPLRRFAVALAALPGLACAAPAVDYAAFAADLDARWDYAKPALSETRFRAELAHWPADSPPAAEIETQIARAQGLQRRFDDARATLTKVQAQLQGMPAHVRIRYLLESGRVHNSSGAPERAVPLFQSALDLAQCGGEDFYAIDAAHMLGIATPAAQRLEWNLKAVAMTQASQDPRAKRWLAPLYNNIAWNYLDDGKADQALAYFRDALPHWRARGNAADVRIAQWAIGRALRATGDLEQAERVQRALLDEHQREGTVDGSVFEELGEIASARGERDRARGWFAKAWAAFKDDSAAEPAHVRRLAELGGIAPSGAPAQ